MFYHYLKTKPKEGAKYTRERIINKITDNRKTNTLYECMCWYLAQLESNEDKTIKCFSYDNFDGKMPKLFTETQRGNVKKFEFEGHTIYFSNNNEKVRIEGEDFDRTNDTIRLVIHTDIEYDDWIEKVFIPTIMKKYHLYMESKRCVLSTYQNISNSHSRSSDNGVEWMRVATHPDSLKDKIVLRDTNKEYLMNEVKHFVENKQWHIDNGFPYKLGICLHGEPGCGKTSTIRYISHMTGRNTHYLRLGQITTERQFTDLLQERSLDLSKSVLVLEDIDCQELARKRSEQPETEKDDPKTSSKPPPLTLDTLLAILDGILTKEGQIVIITTNHKNKLDPALIRPGRVDIDIELKLCDQDMISRLCRQFYGCEPPAIIQQIENDKLSPAAVTNIFRRYRDQSQMEEAFQQIYETQFKAEVQETHNPKKSKKSKKHKREHKRKNKAYDMPTITTTVQVDDESNEDFFEPV